MNLKPSSIVLSLLLSGCGGDVGADAAAQSFSLAGKVLSLEGTEPLERTIRLAGNGLEHNTQSNGEGDYRFAGLQSGTYELQVEGRQWETVLILGDMVKDVILPVPAAPRNFRLVNIGVVNGFCVLWDDMSGVEAGFRIDGTMTLEAPTDRVGVLRELAVPEIDVRDGLEERAAAAWSTRFSGTYYLTAFNEFGDSAAVPLVVYGYTPDEVLLDLKAALPPDQWSKDQSLCLNTEHAGGGQPAYIQRP